MAAPSPQTSSPVRYFIADTGVPNHITSLIYGVKWGNASAGNAASVYFSFPTSKGNTLWDTAYTANNTSELYNQFNPFSNEQKIAAISAIQKWAAVANIQFIEVVTESRDEVGDIRFANSNLGPSTYAYAYIPVRSNPYGGDIWFNNNQPATGGNFNVGGNGYHTLLHEIGHALGLDHPFEGTYQLAKEFDHYQYTVMSYNESPFKGDTGFSDFYPTTPMLLDILAMQYLYGANFNFNSDNTVYIFDENATYFETIWDGGGVDTIQYNAEQGGVINLNAGSFSKLGQSIEMSSGLFINETIAIAYNVTIENAIGGDGNDIFYENNASNVIDGRKGFDTINLNYQTDDLLSVRPLKTGGYEFSLRNQIDTLINIESYQFLNGLFNIDSLPFNKATPKYAIVTNNETSLMPATLYDGPVEYLEFSYLGNSSDDIASGSESNDFINLLGGNDAVNGFAGDDVLDGGTGSNFLTGGLGNDTFFIDGRNNMVTWSTITDFGNEEVNVWGWVSGVSKLILLESVNGADGYQGATFHYDLNNDNIIDTSITFTGISFDVLNPTIQSINNTLSYVSFS